jgi:hypothetical protein
LISTNPRPEAIVGVDGPADEVVDRYLAFSESG